MNAALEDSPDGFLTARGKVAQAHQMSKVAGVQRESLYRMLSKSGNPRYSSFHAVLGAVGLKMSIEPAGAAGAHDPGRPGRNGEN